MNSTAHLLIGYAARRAPATISERLHEEWLADLEERRGLVPRLKFGLGCLWAAVVIAHDGAPEAVLVPALPVPAPIMGTSGGHGHSLYSANEGAIEARDICEMNTTPLIDVMLVLLITLILSLPILNHAVTLDLPNGRTSEPLTPPEVVDLDIDFDGTVVWNGTPLASFQQLEGYFRTEARKEPQPEIRMRPNSHVKYDFVAKVLASAQRNGMRKVGFVNTVQFAE